MNYRVTFYYNHLGYQSDNYLMKKFVNVEMEA